LRDDLENRMPSEVPFLKESNFLAVTSGDDIESVKFTIRETSLGRLMNFNETITYIDNEAPYTAFGDENELFESKLLIEHNYRITTEAYSEDDANGALLASKQVYVSLYDFGVKFGLDLQIIDSDTKELLQEINLNEHPVISAEIFKDRNLTYLVSDGTTIYDSVISGGFLSLDDETGNIATGYQWFTELKTSSDFSFQNGTYKVSVVPDVVHNFLKRPVFTNIWKFNIIDADKVSDTLGDKMIVFPTITKGLITIDNSDREDIATVSVMAINGKRIVQKPINDAPAQIKQR